MPLRDHFRSPVNDTHSWDEVHGQWPGEIVRDLTTILPAGFRAAPKVHLGSAFEVDVGGYDLDSRDPDAVPDPRGSPATLAALSPTLTVEAELSDQDEYEVRIYDTERGRQLVAAIEIVSPANKDRPNTREVFVGKVASLLQQGVCVSLVDLVTVRQANLYAELLTLLGRNDPALAPTPPHLYAVTLRTRRLPKHRTLLDAWFYPMTLGQPLPTLPIWLTPDLRVMLPLESSYQEACRILGIA
ncbi:DUF4058 family protein [Gemmata sp.]|uniref:DUF4058 family protein n=1 Tax=Gemmata sp. TaxID=1914242 RepID=UPI003F730FF3